MNELTAAQHRVRPAESSGFGQYQNAALGRGVWQARLDLAQEPQAIDAARIQYRSRSFTARRKQCAEVLCGWLNCACKPIDKQLIVLDCRRVELQEHIFAVCKVFGYRTWGWLRFRDPVACDPGCSR